MVVTICVHYVCAQVKRIATNLSRHTKSVCEPRGSQCEYAREFGRESSTGATYSFSLTHTLSSFWVVAVPDTQFSAITCVQPAIKLHISTTRDRFQKRERERERLCDTQALYVRWRCTSMYYLPCNRLLNLFLWATERENSSTLHMVRDLHTACDQSVLICVSWLQSRARASDG